jgi:hypothetical protein
LSKDSGCIYWRSKQSTLVHLSSTDAEIDALTEAVKDCIWLRGLLFDLGFPQYLPTVIYQDNKSAIYLTGMESVIGRTRHIANRISFIRNEVKQHTIALQYISTNKMIADSLTKLLAKAQHNFFRYILLFGHGNKEIEQIDIKSIEEIEKISKQTILIDNKNN